MIILLHYFVSGFCRRRSIQKRSPAFNWMPFRPEGHCYCQTQLRTKILYSRLCFLGIDDDGRCPEIGQF